MALLLILVGLILGIAIIAGSWAQPNKALRGLAAVTALVLFIGFLAISSIRYVDQDEIGVLVKNFGPNMPPGQIIATDGEKGPQAGILGPGWHFWYFPVFYDIEMHRIVQIADSQVGLLTAKDGQPLPAGVAFAPEWDEGEAQQMLNASHFLGAGQGFKGPQASVLPPGSWRINPKLYEVEQVPVTNIEKATVGVIKSNVGEAPVDDSGADANIVDRGQRGIWRQPFEPQKIYLNTRAYEVTIISTKQQIIRYGVGGEADETEIEVRTSDGFTFPVDVRIEYQVDPTDAALVVAELGDDKDQLKLRLASTVRAIFRNNAEDVKALDYVNQRSQQESATTQILADEMKRVGVTVTAVRIGQVGDEASLGELLKTQTDREIALQEQETFKEQQRAAEQRKELTRTEQEAEEERKLATAKYGVQISEQDKEKRLVEASAEAEAIRIQAEAQAEAYRVIADQIGSSNAALVEFLKIIGENNINITPRVMVSGAGGQSDMDGETTALIGTMLDTMIDRSPDTTRRTDDS